MRNYGKIVGFTVGLIALSNIFEVTTYANSTDYEVSVVNTVRVGDIQIEIEQCNDESQLVVPNQTINQEIRIHNIAKPAWVRVKLEYRGLVGVSEIETSSIGITSSDWIKRGNYYYYTKSMENDSYIDLCNSLTIPKDWDSSYTGKSFNVLITTEAVQKRNFTPNFGSHDPWFGTIVETSVKNKDISNNVTNTQSFQVIFKDGTQELIRVGDDFFSNFGYMMPGDTLTDYVRITNNYSKSVEICFRTDSTLDSKLLNLMQLEIRLGDNILYKGSLSSESLQGGISLGKYAKGDSNNLIYVLTLPSNAGNEYAQERAEVKWVFSSSLSSGKTTTTDNEDSDGRTTTPTTSVIPTEQVTEPSNEENTTSVDEDVRTKIPDELIDIARDVDDGRLKYYIDKEYLTEMEWQEFTAILEALGVPSSKWMPYLPKTGDVSSTPLYVLVMLVSLIGLVILFVRRHVHDKQ